MLEGATPSPPRMDARDLYLAPMPGPSSSKRALQHSSRLDLESTGFPGVHKTEPMDDSDVAMPPPPSYADRSTPFYRANPLQHPASHLVPLSSPHPSVSVSYGHLADMRALQDPASEGAYQRLQPLSVLAHAAEQASFTQYRPQSTSASSSLPGDETSLPLQPVHSMSPRLVYEHFAPMELPRLMEGGSPDAQERETKRKRLGLSEKARLDAAVLATKGKERDLLAGREKGRKGAPKACASCVSWNTGPPQRQAANFRTHTAPLQAQVRAESGRRLLSTLPYPRVRMHLSDP